MHKSVPGGRQVVHTIFWTLWTAALALTICAAVTEIHLGRIFYYDGWEARIYLAANLTSSVATIALGVVCVFVSFWSRQLPWLGLAVIAFFLIYQALPRF